MSSKVLTKMWMYVGVIVFCLHMDLYHCKKIYTCFIVIYMVLSCVLFFINSELLSDLLCSGCEYEFEGFDSDEDLGTSMGDGRLCLQRIWDLGFSLHIT